MSEELTPVEAPRTPAHIDEPPPNATLQTIITWALQNPDVSLDKLDRLLDIKERLEAAQAKMLFARSMKDAQHEIGPVARDAENPHTKSRYSRLETIDAAIRPVYTKHGFSLSFNNPATEKGSITITCRVRHDAGHQEDFQLAAAPDTTGAKGAATKTEVQGLGSTVSYLRRYLTLMIFNVVLKNEDKDGNLTGFVNEEQANKIIDAIKRAALTPTREAKFLEALGVKAVSEIPLREYARAMNMLEQARRKSIKPLDFDEFPDPVDFQPAVRICVAGSVYERAPDGNSWRPVK